MAANLDKAESSLTTVSDVAYIRAIDNSGNSVRISKADLASVLGERLKISAIAINLPPSETVVSNISIQTTMLIILHADQRYFNGNKILTSDNNNTREIVSIGAWDSYVNVKASNGFFALENLKTDKTLSIPIFLVHQ